MNEETLFHEALARPPAERAAFLDGACAARPEVRAAVEALLAAHEASGRFLDASSGTFFSDEGEARPSRPAPAPPPPAPAPDPRPLLGEGSVVGGRYTLVERIGEGGMGEVWVAKQTEPVRRRVALKLIKAGMDSRAVLARFEQERQALAMMDHPNIARVLDGGMTPLGQPFFVMELVSGLPLTKFCDQAKLTPRERLALFVPICQAVQHAHQKAIVHRDLKPANILVTMIDGKPVPKVIDFGVAKATGGKLTDDSMMTQFGAIVGTLEYMSPEQAAFSGVDVDTRADVYSLGVILYELLTGLRPLDAKRLQQMALTEVIRIVQEEEPSRPSTRLSTDASLPSLAALRQTDPRDLMALLRGELDWVVMRCLEKQRDRRYETANALARDIERYLADEPVEARPATARYRMGKFLRRHRGPVAAAAVVVLALVGGVVGTGWGLVRATEAERVARSERDRAVEAESDTEAFGRFLADRVLAACRPAGVGDGIGYDVTMSQALEEAEGRIEKDFAGRPRAEAAARHALGKTWLALGRYGSAEEHLRCAAELRKEHLGTADPATLDSMSALAAALWTAGKGDHARPLLEETLRLAVEHLGPEHRATLNCRHSLAMAHLDEGRLDLAVPLLEQTLAARESAFGRNDRETLQSMRARARAYLEAGRADLARRLFEETLARQRELLGPDHDDTLGTMNSLGAAYVMAGERDLAPPLVEEVLRLVRARFGPEHPTTLGHMSNLAMLYTQVGAFERAQALAEEALPLLRAKLGPGHPQTLTCLNNLAAIHQNEGRMELARPLFEEALPLVRAARGPEHPDAILALNNLATSYERTDRRALPLFEEALALYRKTRGEDHPLTLVAMLNLGGCRVACGDAGGGLPMLEEALRLSRGKLGRDHPTTLRALEDIARVHREAGRVDLALPLLEERHGITLAKLGPDHRDTLESAGALAAAYWSAHRLDKSIPLLEDSARRCEAVHGPDAPQTVLARANLGVNYKDAGRTEEALALLEPAARSLRDCPDPRVGDVWQFVGHLAECYLRLGQAEKALALMKECLRARETGGDDLAVVQAMNNLAVVLWKAGRLDESIPLLEEVLRRREARLGRAHVDTLKTAGNLGVNYKDAGRIAEAIPLLEECASARAAHPQLRFVVPHLLDAYARTGKGEKAAALVQGVVEEARGALPAASPQLAGALAQSGMLLLELERWAEAEPLLRECLAIREKAAPDAWMTFNTKSMLGGALLGLGRHAEAEPLLVGGCRGMLASEAELPPQAAPRVPEAIARLVRLCESTGRPDEAAKWREELARRTPAR